MAPLSSPLKASAGSRSKPSSAQALSSGREQVWLEFNIIVRLPLSQFSQL